MASRHDDVTRPNVAEPFKMHGLMQAVYVSECLCLGVSQEEIAVRFNGDRQLVDMWVSFVRHNHWVYYDVKAHHWSMTPKGERQAYDIQISSNKYR